MSAAEQDDAAVLRQLFGDDDPTVDVTLTETTTSGPADPAHDTTEGTPRDAGVAFLAAMFDDLDGANTT